MPGFWGVAPASGIGGGQESCPEHRNQRGAYGPGIRTMAQTRPAQEKSDGNRVQINPPFSTPWPPRPFSVIALLGDRRQRLKSLRKWILARSPPIDNLNFDGTRLPFAYPIPEYGGPDIGTGSPGHSAGQDRLDACRIV